MASNIGLGHVTGIAGADSFYGTAVLYQGAEETDDFEKKYTRDAQGVTRGGFAYDGKRRIRIDLVCAASTIAGAVAGLKKPGKLAAITLSTFLDTTINGVWIYEGGCVIKYLNEEVAKITFPLVKFDNDISTPVNA